MNPNEQQPDGSVELEAIAQNGLEANESLNNIEAATGTSAVKLDDIAFNTETQLVQNDKNTNRLLDPLERIAQNTSNTETTFNIGLRKDADDVEFNENQAGNLLWQMLRGPKGKEGEKGEKGVQGEKGDKGDRGEDGEDSMVPGPTGPAGPVGLAGKDGRDGKTGAKGEKGSPGKDGRDGKDADEATLVKVITETVTKEVKEGTEKDIEAIRRYAQGSKTYSISQLEGMGDATSGQVPVKQADGSWEPGTISGAAHIIEDEGTPLTQRSNLNFVGAGVSVTDDLANDTTIVTITSGGAGFTELAATGAVNNSNVTFTFTQVPSYIVSDGVWLKPILKDTSTAWTNSGLTITMVNPPSFDIFGVA